MHTATLKSRQSPIDSGNKRRAAKLLMNNLWFGDDDATTCPDMKGHGVQQRCVAEAGHAGKPAR